MPRFPLLAVLLALSLSSIGCEQKTFTDMGSSAMPTEAVQQYRAELLAEAEPADAQTVIEVRDALLEAGEAATAEVTVVGVIGGMPNPYTAKVSPDFPWVEGMAAFSLADLTTTAEFGDHQHTEGEECIFCASRARELVDTVAQVRFYDAEGNTIPARADKLLQLEEGSTVVVTGTGSIEFGSLVIDTQSVFVRPPEPVEEEVAE